MTTSERNTIINHINSRNWLVDEDRQYWLENDTRIENYGLNHQLIERKTTEWKDETYAEFLLRMG